MEQNKKKAILVVSFGTSFPDTRKKTIDRIEADIAVAYPEYALYRAWTSKMIIAKLRRRDGIAPNMRIHWKGREFSLTGPPVDWKNERTGLTLVAREVS